MSCKCAELDWREVDQTREHHPDCDEVSVCDKMIRVTLPMADAPVMMIRHCSITGPSDAPLLQEIVPSDVRLHGTTIDIHCGAAPLTQSLIDKLLAEIRYRGQARVNIVLRDLSVTELPRIAVGWPDNSKPKRNAVGCVGGHPGNYFCVPPCSNLPAKQAAK